LAEGWRCDEKQHISFKVAIHEGQKGNWLSRADANRLVFVLTECLPRYEKLAAAQDKLTGIQKLSIETSSRALTLAVGVADEERERGDLWKESYLIEREANSSVWASTTLWFVFGVVLGAGTAVAVAFAMGDAHDG
jgi:hypothetical protein